jgi:5S rRNA maturation endonuclease (ribonuclease M5)
LNEPENGWLSRRKIREPDRLREDLKNLLDEMGYLVSAVVVEGPRDVDALRQVGFEGRVEICSRFSVSDSDFTETLAKEAASVVILTDFDEEGRRINRHLTRLLERRGVKVEVGMRREFGRLMAVLGIYVVEALYGAVSRQ